MTNDWNEMVYLGIFLVLVSLVFLLYAVCTCPITLELDERTLELPNLPEEADGLRILFCGDLHLRQWDYRIIWVQHTIAKLKPDVIVFSGDIVEESGVKHLDEFLQYIDSPEYCFFTPGNNENQLKDKDQVFSMFEQHGFHVLLNQSVKVCDGFVVAGTDDPSRHCDDIEKALEGVRKEDFVIMVTHSPELFPLCVEHNIPLTLSGHTHGGQVRLPLVGAVWIDTPRVEKKYDEGFFVDGESQLFVTRGVGMSKLPLRTLCNPQIHLFTLKRGKVTVPS